MIGSLLYLHVWKVIKKYFFISIFLIVSKSVQSVQVECTKTVHKNLSNKPNEVPSNFIPLDRLKCQNRQKLKKK